MESNFELSNLDKSRFFFEKKAKNEKSPFFLCFSFFASFFFKFANIVNIDMFYIQRFMLVFWLFTGSLGDLLKYKINLRLGVYYHHFFLKYKIKKRKFFFILSFLLDEFLNYQYWISKKLLSNSFLLFFNNLEILTNYKLARGVYFYRIQQKFFFKIDFDSSIIYLFEIFLNSLKLYVE